ncbi:glycosyltransferase [Acidisoma cladoniae]|jgi:glycosyltransferase involved in cell wall biosynthesis|uniref:glycosyltransferase n=1 Tax=Acidisoma cladoniae TaxID=3040935 RepID=UPI00254A2B77|nr:glycosyltransferase [Acidisoma sp. PAMC 29798]
MSDSIAVSTPIRPLGRHEVGATWVDAARPAVPGMRIAIVHEWLQTFAGSESVLEQLLLCFPSADVFAVVDFMKPEDRGFLKGRKVQTSFIQRLPAAKKLFRHYLGLMPMAIEQLDVSGYDLIISSSHAVAKGVLTGPDQIHVSYVHSPMRYIWDLQHQYLKQAGLRWGAKALYVRWLFARLRLWDVSSAQHVDHFIANSGYIARRIKKAYARDAVVIHPPVDIDGFAPRDQKDDFFLLAGRFVPYKRADLIVDSFRQQPHRRLVVVGDGPEAARVRAAAGGAPNIEFRGVVAKKELVDLMQRARAVVFAAEEDFGITMVEAQACGTPVIAYGRGGVTDIIITEDGATPTGVLFDRQEPDSVIAALETFDRLGKTMTSGACRENALRFSRSRFRNEICDLVNRVVA